MLFTYSLRAMEIISISKRHNNNNKRRKRSQSKDSTRWYMYYRDDQNKFKTKRISTLQAMQLRLFRSKTKKNKVRIIECTLCNTLQEDLGQKVCNSCGN